jgi:hypothetical protein
MSHISVIKTEDEVMHEEGGDWFEIKDDNKKVIISYGMIKKIK